MPFDIVAVRRHRFRGLVDGAAQLPEDPLGLDMGPFVDDRIVALGGDELAQLDRDP